MRKCNLALLLSSLFVTGSAAATELDWDGMGILPLPMLKPIVNQAIVRLLMTRDPLLTPVLVCILPQS